MWQCGHPCGNMNIKGYQRSNIPVKLIKVVICVKITSLLMNVYKPHIQVLTEKHNIYGQLNVEISKLSTDIFAPKFQTKKIRFPTTKVITMLKYQISNTPQLLRKI